MGEVLKLTLAAFIGGAVTFVLGPIAKRYLDKLTYDSYWAGEWYAVSCREDGTNTGWKIVMDQDGNSVIGRYAHLQDTGETGTYKGGLFGEVELSRLVGRWDQHTVGEAAAGTFSFVLVDAGSAFEGTYTTDSNPGVTRIWNGQRTVGEPSC